MDRSTTWRSILITTCFLLAGINAATINFYCDETVHNAIGGEVIWEVLRSGHDIHLVPHDDKCASNALNKAQSADAFVVLYDSSNLCTVPSKKAQLLVLTYNGTSKMIKSTGDYHNVSDSEDISTFLNGIVVPTSLPSRNSSVKDEKKESETSNEVKLPLWLIVCLGVAIGLLIGGLCIVFMKMRAKRKAAKSSTVSVSKSEKPSKKIKTEKSSTRSTSNSSRKSNSSKSSKSGSSTKSGSSLQCVKVVGSAKGSKSVVTAKPSEMSSDSTAVVVAPSMNRSEKVRETSSTKSGPKDLSNITSMIDQASMNRVSIIGYPSPFQVLAQATTPIQPTKTEPNSVESSPIKPPPIPSNTSVPTIIPIESITSTPSSTAKSISNVSVSTVLPPITLAPPPKVNVTPPTNVVPQFTVAPSIVNATPSKVLAPPTLPSSSSLNCCTPVTTGIEKSPMAKK